MPDKLTDREMQYIELSVKLKNLCDDSDAGYLAIGEILWEVRKNSLYDVAAQDFKDWIAEFKLPTSAINPYSWATTCSNVYGEYVVNYKKPIAGLRAVGRTKLIRMLPLAKKRKLTDELWEMASRPETTDIAIREMMGHNVSGKAPKITPCNGCGGTRLVCSGCGNIVQE